MVVVCQVLSAEDEEQLFNDPGLVIRRRKVGKNLLICIQTGTGGLKVTANHRGRIIDSDDVTDQIPAIRTD